MVKKDCHKIYYYIQNILIMTITIILDIIILILNIIKCVVTSYSNFFIIFEDIIYYIFSIIFY